MKELTSAYIDKGYVTSKVYLKPQDISQGEVQLHAIEGTIEKFSPNTPSTQSAFWFQKGNHLNLKDLEIGIETINRLKSNNAKLKLSPGKNSGETVVEIENEKTSIFNGYITSNNFGQETTGEYQGTALLNIDNPLGINDKITISLNSTDNHNLNDNSKGSAYYYSFALGRMLYTLGYTRSTYEQQINASLNTYESEGTNRSYNIDVNYKLFHNQNNKINLGSFVNNYRSENYIDKAAIETSTYNLSKYGLSIDHLYQTSGFLSYLSVEYTKGAHLFSDYNPTELDEKFSKYTVDLTLSKSIDNFKYNLTFHLQHTQDQLFSVNQISIGGPYSVRGYNKEGLSGNSGHYYRNELSYTAKSKWFNAVTPTIYAGIDGGWIKKEEDTTGGTIIGEFVGLKLNYDSFDYDMYYSKPLRTADVDEYENFFGIQMSYQF